MIKNIFKISLLLMIISFTFSSIYAQTFDLQYISNKKNQFNFNYAHPFYGGGRSLSTLSGVYQISADIPISPKLNIIANVPYINTSYDINLGFYHYGYSENGIGNVFIGLQTNGAMLNNKRNLFTVGVYLPTSSEIASLNGVSADYYHISKYIPKMWGIYFNYAFHKLNPKGFHYGFEVGPDLLLPSGNSNSTSEFLAHYGILAGYQVNQISLNMEFVGVLNISGGFQQFGDRFVNMFNIGAQWKGENIVPMLYYKIYLRDDIRNTVDGVLGLGVNSFY